MHPFALAKPLVLDDPYISRMSEAAFFDFCQQHRQWRIERNAQHEILITAPMLTLPGMRTTHLLGQLCAWWEENQMLFLNLLYTI